VMELVREVVEATPNVPVIAAGGFGCGRAVAAALAIGARGVCLGTKFLLAKESATHPEYQRLIVEAQANDTYYGNLFDVGWSNAPHRVLRNSTVREFERSGTRTGEGEMVARAADGASIPRYSSRLPVIGMTGNIESMALYAGEGVGDCRKVQAAADIIRDLMEEANHWMSL
jgi:NAD(P)H-dependent flavin oxidoreductase YrpB (nitropropane dioxygenase family)